MSSLFAGFARGLRDHGPWHALAQLGARLWHVALPLAEIGLVAAAAYVAYALLNRHDMRKHSAVLSGAASPAREHPNDIMRPHFFQNAQGLWLHHGLLWSDAADPSTCRGIVVLLHGHSEHSRRFLHVAEYLNAVGLAVFVMDHQGFGRSEGDRGHVEEFAHYAEDVLHFMRHVVYEDHPAWRALPQFIMGHSMGGLIAIHATLLCQASQHPAHRLSGALLSSPAVHIDRSLDGPLLRAAASVLDLLAPKAPLIGFPSHPSTSYLQVKLHATFDPLNYQGNVRIHQGLELKRGTEQAIARAPQFRTPVLLLHGTHDMHCDISGSRAFLALVASEDRRLIELPDIKHEPLQELKHIREPILEQVADWIQGRLPQPLDKGRGAPLAAAPLAPDAH